MASHNRYKKVFSLQKGKAYSTPEVLFSQTWCYIDQSKASYIKSCAQILNLYQKIYYFDPLEAELLDAMALFTFTNNVKIHFTNDKTLYLEEFNQELMISNDISSQGGFTGFIILLSSKTKQDNHQYTAYFYTANTDNGLDDLYSKIPHELAHMAIDGILNSPYNDPSSLIGCLPYRTSEEKNQFVNCIDEILKNIFNDISHYDPKQAKALKSKPTFEMFCNKFDDFYQLYAALYSKQQDMTFIENISILETLKNVFCKYYTVEGKHVELAIRHFEQIVNGLESGIGTKHQDLPFLQPLVEYSKNIFSPAFQQFITNECETGKYQCDYQDTHLHITLIPTQDEL